MITDLNELIDDHKYLLASAKMYLACGKKLASPNSLGKFSFSDLRNSIVEASADIFFS